MKHWQLLICLGAFAYQLGACPCGCLDENYWYQCLVQFQPQSTQAARHDHGHPHSHPHTHSHSHAYTHSHAYAHSHDDGNDRPTPQPHPTMHDEHSQCIDLTFVRPTRNRQQEVHKISYPEFKLQPVEVVDIAKKQHPFSRSHLDAPMSALPMRAVTSVMLL